VQRDPSAPPVLDGYTPVRVLGLGGFSDVFLYQQELPRRSVAVKVLSGQLTDAMRIAFVREANLMAALSTHPYIVTIYHAGLARDGRPYLVMEYCSRPSLAERYKQQPLSVADTLRTGIRVAGAVQTLHQAGILHRDIKPANVLTNDYGWPALTDFGIATAFGNAVRATGGAGAGGMAETGPGGVLLDETDTGTIGLSVPWSPPEMFVDVPDPDVRSDVFSLAATLYTVLAGRTPFEVRGGPNGQLDLISRIERGQVTPLTRTDVSPSLLAALARGMAPRREDRWPTALEFARALQRIELELGYAPTGIEVPSVDPGPGRPPSEPDDGDDDGDATRMRAMPTIIAQPAAAPVAVPASPSAPAVGPSPTGSPVAGAVAGLPLAPPASPPSPPISPVAPAASEERPSRRGMVIALVIGGLAVLAVVAIVVAVLVSGTPRAPVSGSSPHRTGGSAVVGSDIPPPTKGVATVAADGTSVTFTWTDPKPEDGDIYYWARSETPDERTATPDAQAVVTGVVPGSRVCVDVAIGRSGRNSAPTRICTAP
jgi:eukaryotic-like serine/threonine-protein kinase